MEPTFSCDTATATATATITAELRAQVAAAVAALPPPHRRAPVDGELAASRDAAFERLQDWAFTRGFAIAKDSCKTSADGQTVRAYFDCVHHKKATRNTRRLADADRRRRRVETPSQATDCRFRLCVARLKQQQQQQGGGGGGGGGGGWQIRAMNLHHNHAPSPDPFRYVQHRAKRPGHARAVAVAAEHRGVISYSRSAAILARDGLELERKLFYNLGRRDGKPAQAAQDEDELAQALRALKEAGVLAYVREGSRDLFWMSPEQVRMGQRFVSGFVYEVDSAFGPDVMGLPLSVVVGIDNCGKTFPLAYCYIGAESAESFRWIAGLLDELVFRGCPDAAVVIGDFSRGLGAAIAAKGASDAGIVENAVPALVRRTEFPETREVTVGPEGSERKLLLQVCEGHAARAIKRDLVAAGKYEKDGRKELEDAIRRWIQAESREELERCRAKLTDALGDDGKEYVKNFCEPKEPQFCRAYTRSYANLGVHSTQRNKSYSAVLKAGLQSHLPLSKAVALIIDATLDLGRRYYDEINRQRRLLPCLLDQHGFATVGGKLTHYALDIAMNEWSAAKQMAGEIEQGREEEIDYASFSECTFGCELPTRYGLPCRHWMYRGLKEDEPLPLSLFHPRWHFDGPPVVNAWKISWRPERPGPSQDELQAADERRRSRGRALIEEAVSKVIDTYRALPADMAEDFAQSFVDFTHSFLEKYRQQQPATRVALPTEPPAEPSETRYRKGKRRAVEAEERERDLSSRRRRYGSGTADEAVRDREDACVKEETQLSPRKRRCPDDALSILGQAASMADLRK